MIYFVLLLGSHWLQENFSAYVVTCHSFWKKLFSKYIFIVLGIIWIYASKVIEHKIFLCVEELV